jgi:hypothetical protein
VNVEDSIREDWMKWMVESHLPEVMDTGLFLDYKFTRVLVQEDAGTTYSIQYSMNDMQSFQLYEQLYAPKLRNDTQSRYGSRVVAFRTLLEVIDYKAK